MSAEIIEEMLTRHDISDPDTAVKALREVLQELVLFTLYQGKFFDAAVFYGGTALRILHGLDRFSEDLDFALRPGVESFSFSHFQRSLVEGLRSFSLNVSFDIRKNEISPQGIAESHVRTGPVNTILSIGMGTKRGVSPRGIKKFPSSKSVKIKLEVDTGGCRSFDEETLFPLYPLPFPLRAMTLPSMFAGKMHALLCRSWGSRVKGRDWYDSLWFLKKKVPLNLPFLEEKLRHSHHWTSSDSLGKEDFMQLFLQKVEGLDVAAAQKDIRPFLSGAPEATRFWSKDLFRSLVKEFRFILKDGENTLSPRA